MCDLLELKFEHSDTQQDGLGLQTADADPAVTHHPMDESLEVLMKFAGENFRKQSETWSAALPNDTP